MQYGYDNLNRVITETSDETTGDYSVEYTHDVVGNRTRRMISANGQCMQTDYEYNSRDQLTKETHIDPSVCYYLNDRPVYAYTSNGQITHYRLHGSSENIGSLKAYLLGIPTKWSNYAMGAIFGLLAISFLLPIFARIVSHRSRRGHRVRFLLRQGLIILLAYMMLLDPVYLHQEAQAAINYGSLSTSNWGTTNRDIHYYYDANGSCVKKIEAVKDTADPDTTFIEKTVYAYNLQNRLEEVRVTTNGIDWDVTTYKYNDDGIRVEKNDNGTVTTYLVDSYNHTGFAQVLEQWDTTSTPTLTKTYIIGDDVIGEADSSSTLTYLLYDGQGSVRHHSDANGDLIEYSGCDTFAYDAYGQRVDPLKDSVNDGLFYTGEQWDSSAQMYYLRARYYNPLTGSFNRMDPYSGNTSDPQSLHKYLYCHANPVNNLDPSGLMGLGAAIGAIGTAISAIGSFIAAHLLLTLVVVVIISIFVFRATNSAYYQGLDRSDISNMDIVNRINGFQTGADVLEDILGNSPPNSNAELTQQLEARGVYQIGELGIGVVGRGTTLPHGEQLIVEYFESLLWNLDHPKANEHPGLIIGAGGPGYVNLWGAAEAKRMRIIVRELEGEARNRKIPGY